MTPFIQACIAANEEIATALEQQFDSGWLEKTEVGAGGDVSSKLDLFAEAIFIKHLSPFGHIDSEESGAVGEGEEKIIIDPIDGSSNALCFFPYFGTSVAKVNADGILDDAIVCNLANGDLFFKTSQEGVKKGKLFSNDFRAPIKSIEGEIGLFEKAYEHPHIAALLREKGLKFRSPGAVALSLAYAHTVQFVLFIGVFRIYDFAAGLALCEGLEVIVEGDYVIVSKDKNIVQEIEALITSL
jgi:myo-inositol-1(or 4)-monophosphatase